MKKIKYLLILLLIISFKNVSAIDNCTSSEMTRLRELANNVEIKYEDKVEEIWEVNDENATSESFVGVNVVYKLVINNYNSDLKLYIKLNNNEKKIISVEELENKNFYETDNIQIEIYSLTNNLCTDELLRTITIKLPIYNQFYYSHKEECIKYPDFKYCEEFLDLTNVDFDKINAEFEKYLSNQNDVRINNDIKINKYLLIGGIVAIVMIITVLSLWKKNKKKKDDL